MPDNLTRTQAHTNKHIQCDEQIVQNLSRYFTLELAGLAQVGDLHHD